MSATVTDRPSSSDGPQATTPKPRKARGAAGRENYIPYLLIVPAALVIVGVLGYPLYDLIDLAFKNVNSYVLLSMPTMVKYIGFDGFSTVLGSGEFWQVVWRTVLFTVELVVSSIVIALAMAALLQRVSAWVKITVVTVLMFVWAIPAIVTGTVFRWIFANTGGVADYVVYLFGGGKKWLNHDWFANQTTGLYFVCAVTVVWGALPFLVIGLNAAMTQVPKELIEASKIDGASPWQSFRHVTIPVIRPFLILSTALSFIWDFQCFGQIWSLRQNSPEPGYRVMGIYLYMQGFASSHYSRSSVISISMILLMLAVLVFYIRQVIKIGEQD